MKVRKQCMSNEADNFETEINECISKAETVAKETLLAKASKNVSVEEEPSLIPSQQSTGSNVSGEAENTGQFQSRLKALKLPVFDGDKAKFEDFGALFISLVDKNAESAILKWPDLDRVLQGLHYKLFRGLVFQTRIRRSEGNFKIKVWWSTKAAAGLYGPARNYGSFQK